MTREQQSILLADFIGKRRPPHTLGPQQWEFTFCAGFFPSVNTMKFHESWDWVMPVYNQIRKTFHRPANGPRVFLKIKDAIIDGNLAKTIDALVEYIQLSNKQKP